MRRSVLTGDDERKLLHSASWLLEEPASENGPLAWGFSDSDIRAWGPNRWGFVAADPAGGLRRSLLDLGDYHRQDGLLYNPGPDVEVFTDAAGSIVRLQPRSYFLGDADSALMVILEDGQPVLLIDDSDNPLIGEESDYSSALSRIRGLLGDTAAVVAHWPRLEQGNPQNLNANYAPYEDGSVLYGSAEGESFILTDGAGNALRDDDYPDDGYIILSPHSVWSLAIPEGIRPLELTTSKGPLFEGSGFRWSQGFLMLYDDPVSLWPDRVVKAKQVLVDRLPARHYPLRVDDHRTRGKDVAAYLRHSRGLRSLFRACVDVAGQTYIDEADTVSYVESHNLNSLVVLASGRVAVLSNGAPLEAGDRVESSSVLGNTLQLRSEATHGKDWFRNRPWSLVGIDSGIFWPGHPGIAIRDEILTAEAYLSGGELRARILFNQDPVKEQALWQALDAAEDITGLRRAETLFGMEEDGQLVDVNPLELLLRVVGGYAFAIEGSLGSYDPGAWRRIRDFLDREKPAGSVAILAPTWYW